MLTYSVNKKVGVAYQKYVGYCYARQIERRPGATPVQVKPQASGRKSPHAAWKWGLR